MMNPTARSVFAISDGLLLFLALEGVFYAIAFLGLHLSFDTPTPTYLACNLLWAVIAAGLGGYTAARVGRRSPLLHGLGVAIPLLLLSVFNLYKGIGNRHTPFVLGINLLVPVVCLGGAWLYGASRTRAHR